MVPSTTGRNLEISSLQDRSVLNKYKYSISSGKQCGYESFHCFSIHTDRNNNQQKTLLKRPFPVEYVAAAALRLTTRGQHRILADQQ